MKLNFNYIKSNFYIEILRTNIEDVFKKNITINDTLILSKDIENKINISISATTLQRFFELISNKSQPSNYTLNILSEYVGYNSWEDLKSKNEIQKPVKNGLITDDFGITLFKLCLKNHDFKTVLEYIDLLPTEEYLFNIRYQIGNTLGTHFRKDQKARQMLLPELAKTINGRTYFYENFVDIDYLNVYFKDALDNYYLKHTKPYNPKQFSTDFIFGNTLAFIADINTGNIKGAIKTSQIIFNRININTHYKEFNHPYPYSRFIAVYLISEHLKSKLNNQKIENSVNKIESCLKNLIPTDASFVLAQLIMALNYCSLYKEIIQLYAKYQNIIENSVKSTNNYLPIIKIVENSNRLLGIHSSLDKKELDYESIEHTNTIENTNLLI